MTLKTMGRGAVASILTVAMGAGLTACSRDYTIAYLYSTAAKATAGLVNGYKIDYQSGTLVPLENSPVAAGKNPVGLVAAPNSLFIYVVDRDDSDVILYAIGTDGKLYPQKTYNVTGSFPTAIAIDAAGKFLYVAYTYQNGFTPALPGPGGVTVFPINSDNTLGTGVEVKVGRNPIGISAGSSNHFVYVVEQDTSTSLNLLGFSASTTTGLLTPLAGTTINAGNVASTGYASGVLPRGILLDSSSSHVYVTDQTANQVISYAIGPNGVPVAIAGGTAATGTTPYGMTFDPSGKYLYVANYTDGSLSGYTLGTSGQPVASTTIGKVQAGTGVTCATVVGSPSNSNPSHAVYLYTSNNLSNTISGLQLSSADGSLRQIQGTPFNTSTLPTCAVTVAAK